MSKLTQDRIKELFHYDSGTGIFTRAITVNRNALAGTVISRTDSNGYVCMCVDGKHQKAHRMAWLYVNGALPDKFIDHVNGVRSDNRLSNLRLSTDTQNKHNSGLTKRNTSGVKGVSWAKKINKWQVQVKLNGKAYWVGYFTEKEAAKEAAIIARNSLHGDFANHGSFLSHRKESANEKAISNHP